MGFLERLLLTRIDIYISWIGEENMKITDEYNIRNIETDLMKNLIEDIDWRAVEAIIRENYRIGINEDIRYRQGDIVVHNDQVAYRVNFDVTVPFSILFDRAGEYLTIGTSEADAGGSPGSDAADNGQEATENEILAEFNREMDALEADEEEPIELTEVVGGFGKATENDWPHEEPALHSAVNG